MAKSWMLIVSHEEITRALADLPPAEFKVWLAVRWKTGGAGGEVRMKQETIAALVGMSRRSIQRVLARLVDAGWLEVTRTGRCSRYASAVAPSAVAPSAVAPSAVAPSAAPSADHANSGASAAAPATQNDASDAPNPVTSDASNVVPLRAPARQTLPDNLFFRRTFALHDASRREKVLSAILGNDARLVQRTEVRSDGVLRLIGGPVMLAKIGHNITDLRRIAEALGAKEAIATRD